MMNIEKKCLPHHSQQTYCLHGDMLQSLPPNTRDQSTSILSRIQIANNYALEKNMGLTVSSLLPVNLR